MMAKAIDLPAGHTYSSACKINENGKRIHSTGGKKYPSSEKVNYKIYLSRISARETNPLGLGERREKG